VLRSEGRQVLPTRYCPMSRVGATVRERGDLQPRVESEFLHDVPYVTLHSMGGDVQPRRDLFVAQPFADETDDLSLPCGHSHGVDAHRPALPEGTFRDLREER